jgi:hypothetical protein
MLSLLGRGVRLCDGISRREALRVGGLGALGLGLAEYLGARAARGSETAPVARASTFGRAKHCILLYMWGGPPHLDTFDMKPDAPLEIRGEFEPISTSVAGISICDHLPLLSRHADKYTIVRSVTHSNGDHISQCHDMLTGNAYPRVTPIISAARSDHPHYGSVLAHLQPRQNGLPGCVQLPCTLASNSGKVIPGQFAGFLGQKFDPYLIEACPNKLAIEDPEFRKFTAADIRLPASVTPERLEERRALLDRIGKGPVQLQAPSERQGMDKLYEQAFALVGTARVREAFDLASEVPATRDRYGRSTFGQGVCMARRLVEAGVPLVTVYWPNGPPRTDIGWDNHINNFPNLKNWQLPPTDRAVSALLDDLARTGKLDETLVVWMGEFGRSPRIDDNGGRDHWPSVFSVVLAGGGVRGGETCGASDGQGAYPLSLPVTPLELGATIFHFLGIDARTEIRDQFTGQPHVVCRGTPIAGLI